MARIGAGQDSDSSTDDDGMSAREARWRDRLSDDDDDSYSSSGPSSSGSSSSSSSSSDDDDDWSRPSNPNQGESVTPDDDDDDSSGSPTRRRRGGGSTGTRGGTRDDDSGGSSGGGGTSGGSTSDSDDSSSSENDNRSSAEQNFDRLDDSDATDDTGSDEPKIPDNVDEQTQRNLRDITDDTASSTPSEAQGAGQEVFGEGFVVEGQQMSQDEAEQFAETQLVDQNDQFGSTSQIEATVTESGEVTYTTTDRVVVGQEAGRDLYIPAGTTVGGGSIPTTQEAAQALEERAIAETPAQDETDVTVDVGDSGLEAELTVSGREQAVAEQLGVGTEDIAVEGETVVPTTQEGLEAFPEQQSPAGSVPRPVNARTAEAIQRDIESSRPMEQFGDYDLQIGQTAITDEEQQRRASDQFDDAVQSATAEGGIFGESAIAAGLEYAGYDQAADRLESGGRQLLRGAGSIINPAAVTLTATEAAEYGIYSYGEATSGRGGELVDDSAVALEQQIGQTVDYARDNPAEFAGMGLGALIGSAAVMGGAARISPRAGTATRYAIQPGEEIAGSAGFRATRRLAGEDTAQRAFPNREPLIFSEEAAIRGARNVRSRVSDLEYQPAETRFASGRIETEGPDLGTALGSQFETSIETEVAGAAGRVRAAGRPESRGLYASEERGLFTARDPLGQPMEGTRDIANRIEESYNRLRYPRQGVEGYDSSRGRFDPTQGDADAVWVEGEAEFEAGRDPDNLNPFEGGSDGDGQLAVAEAQVGGGQRFQTRTRTATETEQTGVGVEPARVETEFGRTDGFRTQPLFAGEQTVSDAFQPGEATQPAVDVGEIANFDVGQEAFAEVNLETGEFESLRFETETETEQEAGQELEFFREVETETEQEFEFETETRREFEGGPDLESFGGEFTPRGGEGARGDIFTGFRNPLTGEEL